MGHVPVSRTYDMVIASCISWYCARLLVTPSLATVETFLIDVGIKRLLDDLGVTVAQLMLLVYKLLLLAVEKRFRGNAATKKTQRNLLKYEDLEASADCHLLQYQQSRNVMSIDKVCISMTNGLVSVVEETRMAGKGCDYDIMGP
ncbi:hypothetical protein Tco_0697236 [Tanacetum coccineum]